MISKYFALDIGRDSQSQFAIFRGQRNHVDTDIQIVQDYIENHYCDKIKIDSLANLINTGRRTFERRFKQATNNSPIEYIQRVRIEAAKKYFEASRKNVTEIMFDVGYTDTKAFRDISPCIMTKVCRCSNTKGSATPSTSPWGCRSSAPPSITALHWSWQARARPTAAASPTPSPPPSRWRNRRSQTDDSQRWPPRPQTFRSELSPRPGRNTTHRHFTPLQGR